MTGTSLIEALKARYESVTATGWPAFFFGTISEGQANALPNVVLLDDGEPPTYQASGDGHLEVVKYEAEFRFVFYAASMEEVDDLSRTLQAAFAWPSEALEVYGDPNVWPYQGRYRRRKLPPRGPNGQYVYEGVTPYKASINPVL